MEDEFKGKEIGDQLQIIRVAQKNDYKVVAKDMGKWSIDLGLFIYSVNICWLFYMW